MSMPETVIKVEGLSKQYRYGVIGHGTLYKDLQSWWARARDVEDPNAKIVERGGPGLDGERFWALKDINCEVKKGEVLGIIGKNGAGKSTLLKILSRVTTPTEGVVKIKGRVASLLEVGTGFHPELTGRENVYLNGTILGMTKSEIDRKFDEIVAFSGIEKFIYTPVKRYSSGMYVRLAFAVAAHLEPEILLVDEVLAVGDVEFQRKCLGKMKDVAGQGRTVLFISHNMGAIRNLCRRTMLLDGGRVILDAPTHQTIATYLEQNLIEGAVATAEQIEQRIEGVICWKNPYLRFRQITIFNDEGVPRRSFHSQEDIRVSVVFECFHAVQDIRLMVYVVDENAVPVLGTYNRDDPAVSDRFYRLEPGIYDAVCVLPGNTFGEREFFLTVHLEYPKTEHIVVNKILSFDVRFEGYNEAYGGGADIFIRPQLKWTLKTLEKGDMARQKI